MEPRATPPRRSGFLASVTQNLGLKTISLASAIVVYGLVHGTSEVQRTVVVDVVGMMPSASANKVLVRPLPPSVRVTIRGAKTILDELKPEDLGSVQVDLRSAVAHLELEPSLVHAPTGVRVEQIDPPSFDLNWEDRTTRQVPLQVAVMGTPAPGYVVSGPVKVTPTTLLAEGPQSAVAALQFARVDAFDVVGLQGGRHERTLAVDRPPPGVHYAQALVGATVEIAREIVERPFTKLKVQVVGQPTARTAPAEVDVHLRCAPDYVNALRPDLIVPQVTVDAKEAHGSISARVSVALQACEATVFPEQVIVRW